jgi:hypothetical protein
LIAKSIISGMVVDIGHLQPLTKSILRMQYNFGQGGQTNGKAGKQAAVPSWAKATKKVVVKC